MAIGQCDNGSQSLERGGGLPRMKRLVMLALFIATPMAAVSGQSPKESPAQTGTSYRFQADTSMGTVWVSGENARREFDAGEAGTAAGRVEIWRDGGKQVFVLNPTDRTYYEDNAFRARRRLPSVSVDTLTVRSPLRVDGVENLQVDLKVSPQAEIVSGYPCRRAVLTFSYVLKLTLAKPSLSMPGRVEGAEDFCVMDAPTGLRLPFGHGIELTSGHPQVDAAVAERLAALKGIPVARMLNVTRRIENGDPVSAASALLVSDVRDVVIRTDRFEVPKDYRFREPEITPPVRKHP